MKTFVKTIVAVLCSVVLTMGMTCEAKKSPKIKGEKLQAETVCQQLQEEKPALRSVGEGTNFNQSFAQTYAEAQARSAYARSLSSLVTTASKASSTAANAYTSNGSKNAEVNDQTLTSDALAQQMADQSIMGMSVIKKETYKLKDKQYHVFVCMEYMGGVENLAQDVTDAYMVQVNQLFPDEDEKVKEVRSKAFYDRMLRQLRFLNGQAD